MNADKILHGIIWEDTSDDEVPWPKNLTGDEIMALEKAGPFGTLFNRGDK